jgi:MerR family transcriptional regulator, redox-sensitive transcriptional activator SoxR
MIEEMSIGEVAKHAGVNTSTVRYYDRLGLLPKPRRVHKHRRFDPSVLHWLTLIDFAQKAGLTLAEIQRLFHGFEPETPPAERWQVLAGQKLPQIDALIARAQEMKRLLEQTQQCTCERLEDCASPNQAVCGQEGAAVITFKNDEGI